MTSTHQMPQESLKQGAGSSWQIENGFVDTVLAKCELLESLKDAEYREGFIESHVYTGLSFQIRTLREKQGLTQAALGKLAKMAQERISILEDPNAVTKPALNTLLRLAKAFGVGLHVRFAPFSKLIDEAVRTDEDHLNVHKFQDELPELERDLFVQKDFAMGHIRTTPVSKGGHLRVVAAFNGDKLPRKPADIEDGYYGFRLGEGTEGTAKHG